MSIGDLLFRGAVLVFVGSLVFWGFVEFFLGEDMGPRMDTVWNVWKVCFFVAVLGGLLKYSGRMGMKLSKKKCIKCSKAAAMGSIYCEFHLRQAKREIAFDKGAKPIGEDEDEENLGY